MKKRFDILKVSLIFIGILAILSVSCNDNNELKPQINTASVNTIVITKITASTAVSGGESVILNGVSILSCGVCWSVNPSPTISDSVTTDSLNDDHFTSTIANLTAGTSYFVRAYITNIFGTTYGNTQLFRTRPIDIASTTILADSFLMAEHNFNGITETPHKVFLNSYRIGQYEITNNQYALFLNENNIIANGLFSKGKYPSDTLIYESSGNYDWGLHYINNAWVPVIGYENYPVINTTWFGAVEFAAYVGGRLPTEAEWEYACRYNTTVEPFYTGNCLTNDQANYNWGYPYPYLLKSTTTDHNPFSTCINSNNVSPGKTQKVGSYPPNGFGLYDMYGNVNEWCNDWYEEYTATPKTNPQGPLEGTTRVLRGGDWRTPAEYCCSVYRNGLNPPSTYSSDIGFRVVICE